MPPVVCVHDTAASIPDVAQFEAATGADFDTVVDIIYGVIGANQDSRDWPAIMASADPVAAARAATAAMYNGAYCRSPEALKAPYSVSGIDITIVAQVGNFQYQKVVRLSDGVVNYQLMLIDGDGYGLTTQASRVINFGFDTSVLVELKAKILEAGAPISPSYTSGLISP